MSTTRERRPTYQDLLLPRIVELAPNLYGACFTLMKLLPAVHILESAYLEGALTDDSVVVETTSGTFGLALAMICNQRGWKFVMVTDPIVDDAFRRRVEDLGATVDIVTEPAARGGYQQSRLDRVQDWMTKYPNAFCPRQYSNPRNQEAYADVAIHLLENIDGLGCVVGPVGSGGSMCGTVNALRRMGPSVTAVGIDTPGSVLFGHQDGPRVLRGLGNSLMPANLHHEVFDEIHWIQAAPAFRATRELHQQHSLFMGPTSGTAYAVARWWVSRHPESKTVCLLPDEGYRYLDSVYNDEWLTQQGLLLSELPSEPLCVTRPEHAAGPWSYMAWQRRRLSEVKGL